MLSADLIAHISPEEYWFSGSLTRASAASAHAPLVLSCTFLNNEGRLLVEGTYRFSQSETAHPFSLSFEGLLVEATPIHLNSAHTGSMQGQFYVPAEAFLALLTNSDGNAICCEVRLLDNAALRLVGAARVGASEFSFVATGSPDTDRITLGNVVSLFGGKRA
jgi:hypothetical protein